MSKSSFAAAKILSRQIKPAYFTGILVGLMLLSMYIVAVSLPDNQTGLLSLADVGALTLIVAAIVIPSKCLRRLINLGGKREDFWRGSALVYAVISVCVALLSVLFYYTVDDWMLANGKVVERLSIIEAFGFTRNGAAAAFLRQVAVWFFFAMFVHTLTLLQDCWIGWAIDVLIVAIISVFTPIAPLRAFEAWFWRMVIFQPNAFAHILTCLALGLGLFALNRPILGWKDL
ncbi:MAG: hypothetical protein LBH66_06390 [Oscillospiraceae bacterium]|nr:hypothetical protein [Oscillospiraceae bacterium]